MRGEELGRDDNARVFNALAIEQANLAYTIGFSLSWDLPQDTLRRLEMKGKKNTPADSDSDSDDFMTMAKS